MWKGVSKILENRRIFLNFAKMEKSIDNKIPLKAQNPGHGLSRKRIICMAIVFAAGMFLIFS